jgi:hypothetical protein
MIFPSPVPTAAVVTGKKEGEQVSAIARTMRQWNLTHRETWKIQKHDVDETGKYTSATVGGNVGVIDVAFTSRIIGKPNITGGVEGDNRWYIGPYTTSGEIYQAVRIRTVNAAGAFTDGIVVHLNIERKRDIT